MVELIQSLPDPGGRLSGAKEWRERLRAVPGALAAGTALLPFDERDRCASEQYRLVRTKLAQRHNPRVLAISSPQRGDGKTVTSINLAAAVALKGREGVLLLDADLRKSAVASLLGVPLTPGLSEVLCGRCSLEDAIVRTELVPGLFLLPAGELTTENPAELFDGPTWPLVCAKLRSLFENIVVDTTPVGVVADYELVQAEVDGIVLVVRPDHTNRDRLYAALRLVSPEKLLGVVCNCVPKGHSSKHSYEDYKYYRPGND